VICLDGLDISKDLESQSKTEIDEEKEKIEQKKMSDKVLVFSIISLIIIFGIIFGMKIFRKPIVVETVDDLHEMNLQGELDPEIGYLYNGYSFVQFSGLWYTQVQNEAGTALFDIALHYGPRDLEDIPVIGRLNSTIFDQEKGIYITFNPLGQDLQYIAVAVGEFDQSIIKAFGKIPVPACDRNETEPCEVRPIITCNNTNKPVLYLKNSEETKVIYDNNCIIAEGSGFGIVQAVNRILMELYGIMG